MKTKPALAALLAAALLSACGGHAGADIVADPAGSPSASPAASPTASPSPTAPTEAPKPGQLPDFPYADYSYTLGMACFCAFVDQRWRITVADGEVTDVAWATAGQGHQAGDRVGDQALSLPTIQDVIDKGNDPGAAEVRVYWPAGQLYPHSVYVDQLANAADDEISYVLTDMVPA